MPSTLPTPAPEISSSRKPIHARASWTDGRPATSPVRRAAAPRSAIALGLQYRTGGGGRVDLTPHDPPQQLGHLGVVLGSCIELAPQPGRREPQHLVAQVPGPALPERSF